VEMQATRTTSTSTISTRLRGLLIMAGLLLLAGEVVSFLGGFLHPHLEVPNNHAAVFAEYAASRNWLWVHYLQFLSAVTVIAGFVVLYQAMARYRSVTSLERSALAAGVATVAVFAVNMAVDGIALKRAVDAWVAAPAAQKEARFAAAETVRWLEWGANSFFQILFGLTITLFGLAIARNGIIWRFLGWIAGVAGLGLIVGGVLTGRNGFAGSPFQTVALLLFVAFTIGVLVAGFLTRERELSSDDGRR
jgi:uncharacterized membrane protein